MAIDVPTDELNIKDMVIKSPEKSAGGLFDPQRDIPENVWRQIDTWSEEDTNILIWGALLDPDRARRNGPAWDNLSTDQPESIIESAQKVATRMVVDRQKAQKLGVINEEKWTQFKQLFDMHNKGNGDLSHVTSLNFAFYAKLIDPAKSDEFTLSETQWEKLKKAHQDMKMKQNLDGQARFLAEIKVVDPERFKEFKLTDGELFAIKEKVIDDMKSANDKSEVFQFVWNAASLAILSAKEVKITDAGVELVPHDPTGLVEQAQEPVPQARRF